MVGIRDIRRRARMDLHEHMKVQALYLPPNGAPGLIHVRVHTKFHATSIEGGVRSGHGQMVSRQEADPCLIFMLDELHSAGITLAKNAIISVEYGEAYRLNNAEAPDDLTVKWFVTAITRREELMSLPVPSLAHE
ncbi:hypothetical protein [Paracoccus sp. (in: a-proteobacteria)]|uniref:hypothetical protein n=1 Tax=Paracoccus sp. TaxID=267 RepID=UPI0026DF3022|nr:hypothetical protein [Paracoccus sp. (in: a-proteobacteria)]MDO5646305.1 hypothetical protein [Paracoccus sp. (in: a-proteobacteria)]